VAATNPAHRKKSRRERWQQKAISLTFLRPPGRFLPRGEEFSQQPGRLPVFWRS
jgi:hypothetical protein